MQVGIPQAIWLSLALIGVCYEISKHGEPETGEHNAITSIVATVLVAGLLYWGGFFG